MRKFFYIAVLLLSYSCSTTKNVPEGKYLLEDATIKSDSKALDHSALGTFIRQQPNSSLPLVGKLGLKIYDLAGDTSKWYNKLIRSIGHEPVIFSDKQAVLTASQIQKELQNEGYINAKVDTVLVPRGEKKIAVVYTIKANEPYRIRSIKNEVSDTTIARILNKVKGLSQIKPGALFDQATVEGERIRMTSFLRNRGYYNFSKEYLFYRADTTLNSHQVDLFLSVKDSIPYKRYKFRNISIKSGFDPFNPDVTIFAHPDTIVYEGLKIIRGKNKFLSNSVLVRNEYLKPGKMYADNMYAQTVSSFNGIGAIKQTNIVLNEVDSLSQDRVKYLDASILITPGNVHWLQTGVDGTNSAGNLGVAPSISYQHQNLFNTATLFSLKLKGAYEFISGGQSDNFLNKSYYEYGAETSLTFPQFLFPWLSQNLKQLPTAKTTVSLSLNNQHRPEYTRQFFNSTLSYKWTSNKNRLNHYLNLLDINYIRMPWTSASFDSLYLADPVMRTTYSNELIVGTNYTITYANANGNKMIAKRNTVTIRAGIDFSGLLPRLLTSLSKPQLDSLGQREILGIAYAEYIKGDFSFAQTHRIDQRNSLAYHVAVGVANPYGNSIIMPFEKRYFSGGSNSVRGWNTRTLGPGSFKANNGSDFVNQVGDIQLDLSMEYRSKVSDHFELAGFVDGGNIWTIRDYANQPGGLFKFNTFYKEIALAYGTGVRFDLGFLLLRLDFGMKAYDPARDLNDRWVLFRPQFSRDFAWHFAIGYPF